MKYVEVPEDIQVIVNGTSWMDAQGNAVPPWSLYRYLENIVLADPSIGTTYAALKSCNKISDQFEKAKPGDVIGVEDAHWSVLQGTINAPKGGGVSAQILRQFIPFMDAILQATDAKPEGK